jgi:AraC-like DNA-binding protein
MYTTLTISEIARHASFPDIYTFSRFIKSHTGLSPRALRKT